MDIASYIDHTALKPDLTAAAVRALCEEAKTHRFAGVCVPPYYVPEAKQALSDSSIQLATVIGFPLGYAATVAKVEEIKRAIDEGATELDVVINLAALKSGNWNFVRQDLDRMITAVHLKGKVIKVIIEGALLTEEEMAKVCGICNELEPDFVKTSTGFNGPGATVEMIATMRRLLSPGIKLKASGGIRSTEDAIALIEAGANRLGSSSGVKIVGG
ncbi:MAG: deoxyribose-phosphate aldolase [Lewinella sp.]|nr:deoxyribose-phosphate aldolase [Lewinella sp.]